MSPRRGVSLLPVRRLSAWLWLVGWVVLIIATSGLAGKIWSVTEDGALSWLPRSAESTRVVELQERFAGDKAQQRPVIVVYHRDSGVTDADKARAEADLSSLWSRYGPVGKTSTEPVVSKDGLAVLVHVPLREGADPGTDLPAIRDAVAPSTDGLDVKVTGPVAFQYDLDQTYQSIDVTLLLVTVVIVAVLLLATYRSAVLWLLPLVVVAMSNQLANAVVYVVAKLTDTRINSAAIFVITVLVYGVGTDYALLLITRYREELHRHQDNWQAIRAAVTGTGGAILASGATVTLGLLCMMAADLNSTRSLGPAGAIGVVCAFLAMVTLMPAILGVLGRWVFWPRIPRHGTEPHGAGTVWGRIGTRVARRPRMVWIGSILVLGVLTLGLLGTTSGLPQDKAFRGNPDSIAGQRLIEESFPAGTGQPVTVIANAPQLSQVVAAARTVAGVVDVREDGTAGGLARMQITIDDAPGTDAERVTVAAIRGAVGGVAGAEALVGGAGAQALDLVETTDRDERVVIPLILGVVLVVLILLLRSFVGPVLLVGTVVLSFAAALGISGWLSTQVLGFGGIDPSLTLNAFAFLVAVGVDYNIFLVSRIRQETLTVGTRKGTLIGLSTTGGVITSAGLVLAGTFAALGVLPVTATVELGLAVAIGVLLDTFLVRSVLVPALILDSGRRFWWPGRLARRTSDSTAPAARTVPTIAAPRPEGTPAEPARSQAGQ